jgi:hypothetical protein
MNQQDIWNKMGIKMEREDKTDKDSYIVSDPETFNDKHLKLTYNKP